MYISLATIEIVSIHGWSSEESRAKKGREAGSREEKWPTQQESQAETHRAHCERSKTLLPRCKYG